MPFWSSQTLKARIPAQQLLVPYDEDRVVHAAYEMGVGSEAFITSNASDKTQVPAGNKIVIPPGQFGLLVTQETVHIPADVIAFISIRAGIKFCGLVNVSGFHVDPGFRGQLRFAVYNAGSQAIVLDQDQRVFMIWFADLDEPDQAPYANRAPGLLAITSDLVSKIQGDVASPAMLRKELEQLKVDVEKKFHASEQTRLFNRAILFAILSVVVTIALALIKPYIELRAPAPVSSAHGASNQVPPVPQK